MIRKQVNGIGWLEFELLAERKDINHAVFLRHGGVSQGAYSSLNAGAGTADQPDAIEANLNRMRALLGVGKLETLYQTHGVNIVEAPSQEKGEGDVLITRQKDIGLTIRHADCQATLFYDPKHRVVANVHCGWRGNVQNIYAHTVQWLKTHVGSDPRDLIACVSPSLGPNASEFINHAREFPPSFLIYQTKPNYFNLWELSRQQLLAEGLLLKNIEIAEMCTFSQPQDFFSYRRGKQSGRHATIIALV